MNSKIYDILANNSLKNDISYPFWVYQLETIEVSSRRFIKIYLFDRTISNRRLEKLTVKVGNYVSEVTSFNEVSEFHDSQILGCFIELPEGCADSPFEILDEKVNGLIIASSGQMTGYDRSYFPLEDDYLMTKKEGYRINHVVYPQIKEKYWQCSCGRIHSMNETSCHCSQTLQESIDILHFDFSKSHEDDKRILMEKKKQAKKRIRLALLIAIPAALIIAGIIIVPRTVIPYVSAEKETDLRKKYIEFSKSSAFDSQNQADAAYKQRITEFFNEGNYSGVIEMVQIDNKYTTYVSETNLKQQYLFKEQEMNDMYEISKLFIKNPHFDSNDLEKLQELHERGYTVTDEIFCNYYSSLIKIAINQRESDFTNSSEQLNLNSRWFIHFKTSGGFPYIDQLSYDVKFPDGSVSEKVSIMTESFMLVKKEINKKEMKDMQEGVLTCRFYLGDMEFKTVEIPVVNN